jgi:AcrR family transcriptional regulator
MAAAAKVFARDGLHGTSLDRVAREAGITKGTIYLYYRSKEDLFLATMRQKSAEAFAALEAAGRAGGRGDFRRRLASFAEAAYRAMGSPEALPIIQMVLAEAGRFPETAELFFREFILKNNRRLAAVLEQGMAAGELRRADPLVAARCLIGMLLVFVLSQKVLGGERVLPLTDRRILRTVASIFLDGIARRDGPGRSGPARRARRGTR